MTTPYAWITLSRAFLAATGLTLEEFQKLLNQKAHTDKNLVRVNETTGKATDEAAIAYPVNATLDKDTGFQGYEPVGVLTRQLS